MIKGTGIDIIEISRFKKIYDKFGCRLLKKIFNNDEIPKYKNKNKYLSALAGKFAAKEAISKALGTGFGNNLSFLDIKILNLSSGQPYVVYKNNNQGYFHISISHSKENAIASAIVEI